MERPGQAPSREGDAEAAAAPVQQPLVPAGGQSAADPAGGRHAAEDGPGRRGSFPFFCGRAAILVAVVALGVALGVASVGVLAARADSDRAGRTSGLGAAVCVLGQMSRLEVQSKMQNIIEPLSSFAAVDVFLSLETGDHGVFNNPLTADVDGTQCRDSTLGVDGVKWAFAPYFRDAVFGPHVDENITLSRWPSLYTAQHLLYDCKTANDCPKRRTHIANVVSQMRHQKECVELIHKREKATGSRYDIVVKVRDNTIALRPVVPEKLFSIREVVLKHCNWWGGVHDKVMALPREYLESSLGATYPSMLGVMNDDPPNPKYHQMTRAENTEQVVLFTLTANRVPFRQMEFEIGDRAGADYLPFVDGRCYPSADPGGEARWCIVSHCKDCWPSAPWTYDATCEIAVTGQEVPPPGGTVANRENASFEQTLAVPDPERECLKPIYR